MKRTAMMINNFALTKSFIVPVIKRTDCTQVKVQALARPLLTVFNFNRCYYCRQESQQEFLKNRPWTNRFHQYQPHQSVVVFSTLPKGNDVKDWQLSDDACPQGVQGDINDDKSNYKLWLESCKRYGLANCDQQLEGIQCGRKTIAEVIAEQDKLIASIAEEYRRQNAIKHRVLIQGVQDHMQLPDINTPCPQGVQGEDCARFKLWLENCHRFRFENCSEELENYSSGRKTLQEIFEDQDRIIRETAAITQKKLIDQESTGSDETQSTTSKALSSAQKLKNAVAVYGSTVMVFHISISLASLGFFYTLVSSGIDVVGLISRLGIGESILQNKLATGTGTFVVAYAVHKVFAPARIALTLTATPLIVRYLRRIGFLKTPPKK